MVIRIGTRKSRLAMAQTMLAADALKEVCPGIETEIVPIVTTGDRILNKSLIEFGGKGVFVSEFEEALLDGKIDVAAHSAKDLPMELAEGLEIAAVLRRREPGDVFITVRGREPVNSPMVVGTGSLRRQVQIGGQKDVVCRLLRGNIDTRLEKLYAGEYDAIILAAAGLSRLGFFDDERFVFERLPEREFLPAGGQGIIALEARKDSNFHELLRSVNHVPTEISLLAEREVLKLLGAGCNEAIGVYSWQENGRFFLKLMRETAGVVSYRQVCGTPEEYARLSAELIRTD